ncbi:MAG: CHAT domain-containing protein [Dechloromonas agitata]|uniref:CHAT domain-containing protein n=1 Tax=Dechloromonas agitata TaxID=73030 RepID=A0A930G000_9RHOO|nr:CHAT domain-containing protein [Dechloromonas agitata]
MSQQSFKLRGQREEIRRRGVSGPQPLFRLTPGTARDGAGDTVEVSGDTVVRVELDNGFVLWSRMDDLSRDFGTPPARDGDGSWEISRLAPRRAAANERGLAGLAVRILDFFGIDRAEKSAAALGEHFEEKLIGKHPPGFYRLDLAGEFALKPVADDEAIPADAGPLLVFLHGTASSAEGSFGKLWDGGNLEGARLRQSLLPLYGDRVFALEHRTLTQSPIDNALALARRLPAGADVHLVSHSRGGLVGEVLCLADCADLAKVLNPDQVQTLFAADRTLAPQLGLMPLSEAQMKARDAAYDADRQRLLDLVAELERKQLRIGRFVRVACPARGTTLASGRLDRWLSVLDYVATAATGGGLFTDGLDFLLAVVKERTDPRTLPGVEAMMPGSALTRLLNATPELITTADLSVIAGDIEAGDGLWNTLKVLATDWFYRNEHDLVVDTASMLGGLPRLGGAARYRQDQGPKVNHFRYFTNDQSVRWLSAGLSRADGDNAGFQSLAPKPAAAPRCAAAIARSRGGNKPRPIAVVLPGTMGSELVAGDDPVWLNYWALLKGGLKKIAMGREGIAPVGLVDQFYGPLVEFLARSHQVEIFPYDWRFSVRKAAARLVGTLEPLVAQAERSGQPFRLVAHSMGGLVVRSMIADGGAGTALWKRITQLPGSRFLMLGTPNLGSYEAVRWLTGFNPTQAKLSLLDITQSTDQIINLVARYPGLLELLPFAPDDPDFTDTARWQKLRQELGARWDTAQAADLQEAGATWKFLKAAALDPRFMAYVAGCQPATVIDYQLTPGEMLFRPDLKRLEFIATREGDGTVAWSSGRLPGVPVWYVDNTAHDCLCAQPKAFPAYLDILVNGQTTLLPSSPPARARAAAGEERFVLPAAPPADGMPSAEDIAGFGFSGQLPEAGEGERATPLITVSIRHGNLTYARHPVLVGHYQGDTVVSAEAALDRQLNGHLTRRLDLGIYPGPLGSHSVFLNDSPVAKPMGAIVVGLGEIGSLSPGQLEASVRDALLDYALKVAYWPDARFGEAGRPRSAAVTCLLVGTGGGGLPIGDSVEAMLRAAVAANQTLANQELDGRVLIDRLELLELYEDVAISAAEALGRVLQNETLANAVTWPAGAVETAQAGRRRVRFDTANEWYQRLEIVRQEDKLRFLFPTDKARAEETLATGQLALADAFVQAASRDTGRNSEATKTLYEMLLPLRLRELAPQQGNLVVIVDRQSARYPWELLENRWSNGERPPSVAAGFVRQFRTDSFRQRPLHSPGNTALVIGNPDLQGCPEFADLPGAREEAQAVADQLSGEGYEVIDCVDQPATPIMEALHKNSWRILHLAGHGVHEHPAATGKVSGMVIGPSSFLTPGDIAQMRYVPELVFINCCHLGRVDGARPLDRLGLAANLGEEFIAMGVRAVIAAGWAVDDRAGQAFAATFYRNMLAGETFGEAVRIAREDVWLRFPDVNTWGAYQCYGDPDFRFHRDSAAPHHNQTPFATAHELVSELDNLAADLRAGATDDAEGKIERRLGRIPANQQDGWLARAEVQAALGLAWGEARRWPEAIACLEAALTADKGDCSMKALEQYANFRVRYAAELWQKASRQSARNREMTRQEQIERIESAILDLDTLCRRAPTTERLNLLGSAYKRLALIEDEGPRRTEALVNMAEHYRLAYERKRDAYAFTNWLAGSLLTRQRGETLATVDPASQQRDLEALLRELAQRNEADPNFWDSASLADLQLIRLLSQPAGPPRKRGDTSLPPAMTVLATYRNAIARGASPREVSSVAEHIAFLIALWSPDDKPKQRILQQIQENLS